MKASRDEICQQILSHYKNDGVELFHSIVTAIETWAYHAPKMKCQSMEYDHKSSSTKINKWINQNLGKFMVTVLWNTDGTIHMGCLEVGPLSEDYMATLKTLDK